MNPSHESRRPRDLALLMLAIGDEPPRQRARDQQADLAGLALRRRVFERLAEIDPDPDEAAVVAALDRIVHEIGTPTGPARSIAALFLNEWTAILASPPIWEWLLAEAVDAGQRS